MILKDEFFTANQAVAQLLSDKNLLGQSGELNYYVLPETAVEHLLSGLPGGSAGEATVTRVWNRTVPENDVKQDAVLEEMAARLQAMTGGARPENPPAAQADTEQKARLENPECQYGEQAYILSSPAEVELFLQNFTDSRAGEYSQTRLWTKPVMTAEHKNQAELLKKIIARIQNIETRLEQLELLLQSRS